MKAPIPTAAWIAPVILLLLSSCTHYVYMPNMQQVPLLREKGEFRAALSNSTSTEAADEVAGSELQVSAAITRHWGLMLNAASYRSQYSDARGRFLELGAGRFRPLGPHWTTEWYAGLGRGVSTYGGNDLKMWRLFAQPSIGYASRNFDFAFTMRIALLDHDLPSFDAANLADIPSRTADLVSEFGAARTLVEPGFILRGGGRAVKFQLQYVHSINLGRPMEMLTDNFSMGLQFNLNNSFRPRWEKKMPQRG